jgi:UDP-N-acetylglucosamine 2-epimerase (hydrolysing)
MKSKRIGFLTGTRADYGKQKSLIKILAEDEKYSVSILVFGMHLMTKYGFTVSQILEDKLAEVFTFPQTSHETQMEIALAETIKNLSAHLDSHELDLLVVHGDRIETLAGAIVGAIRNIPVAHIEGGEVSGTIDGLIRHSVSKLSHLHFVSNNQAEKRLIQIGEFKESIFTIGSPDIDIMFSENLPTLIEVKDRYGIEFNEFSICLYHPVTNELNKIEKNAEDFCNALISSGNNYVVIKPNNDLGSDKIQNVYKNLLTGKNFLHLPSMRFEYFLTLMKNSKYIIGNSSAGIRESAYYGIPAVNIGSRQLGRHSNTLIIDSETDTNSILEAIASLPNLSQEPIYNFGKGDSCIKFKSILDQRIDWPVSTVKKFVDLEFGE